MSRTRAENRYNSTRKALRKQRISEEIYHYEFYDNLHEYSKNKVHCSCPCCSPKTRNKSRRKTNNYNRSINYKVSDRRKIERMNSYL